MRIATSRLHSRSGCLIDRLRERVEQARAAGPEATDALSEARAVVLILRAAQSDWRASAWWLERRWPERWTQR
jgi:hypothetical protein